MTGPSRPLNEIRQFSAIAHASKEQIEQSGDKGKQVVGRVAAAVLKEMSRPEHVSENPRQEFSELSEFIEKMELFSPGAEDQTAEAVAFRTTLVGLKGHQAAIRCAPSISKCNK